MNHNCFDVLSEEASYWVGFIMADGSICETTQNRSIVEIALSRVDKNHLIKFNTFLQRETPVYDFTHDTAYGNGLEVSRVSFNSPTIVNKLKEYGITNKKSLTAQIAPILEYNRHFWRGALDGDGCIYFSSGYPAIEFIGALPIVKQFETFVHTITNPSAKTRSKTNSKIFKYSTSCKYAVSIIEHIYTNASIYLDRKYAIAQKIISQKHR